MADPHRRLSANHLWNTGNDFDKFPVGISRPLNFPPTRGPNRIFGWPDDIDPICVSAELAIFRISPGVMGDLAVVNLVLRLFGENDFFEPDLGHPLEADTESPHHFSVANQDYSFVATFTMESVQDPVYSETKIRKRLSVWWPPKKRFHFPAVESIPEFLTFFGFGVYIQLAPIPLGQVEVAVPLRTRQIHRARRLHGSGILRCYVSVEARTVVVKIGHYPLAGQLRLSYPPPRKAKTGRVSVQKFRSISAIIAFLRKPFGFISLRLSVPD